MSRPLHEASGCVMLAAPILVLSAITSHVPFRCHCPKDCRMLEARALTKDFGQGEQTLRAVDHLSFEVRAGEVYGLLGANGAGKTTTLRMIMGLLPPTSGEVTVDGYQVTREPEEVKRRIGLVSASTGVYQWLTPREMLQYFGDVYSLPTETTARRIDELSRLLDFAKFLDRACGNLSTGQKQRINLARALLHDPPMMLLDEPTRGLDILGTQVIFEYIGLLKSQGKAVVLSTHRLDESERFADRFGLIDRGQLRFEGTLADLREQTGCEHLVEMFVKHLGQPVLLTGTPHAPNPLSNPGAQA
jgi:ABC-2 type transport system ATP-binding protein/sodium transport system ATP-binding protein